MIIGVIGKSGSGKSTVAKYIAEKYKFTIIDLDQIGKEVVDIYPSILEEISLTFGSEYVICGKLDRAALGKLVFNSSDQLVRLNQIFFKYITSEIKIRSSKHAKCVLEGAVLIELGIDEMIDKLIYVQSTQTNMLNRLQQREKTPLEFLQKRLDSQQKYDLLIKLANFVIENDDSLLNLQKQIDKIMQNI